MKAQKFEKKGPQTAQAAMDRLLMKNMGQLVQLTEQKKLQAKSKKDFTELLTQQLEESAPAEHPSIVDKDSRFSTHFTEIYALRLQKWKDTLKEKFLYAKWAPLHWASSVCLTFSFSYIALDLNLGSFSEQEDAGSIQIGGSNEKEEKENAPKQKSALKQLSPPHSKKTSPPVKTWCPFLDPNCALQNGADPEAASRADTKEAKPSTSVVAARKGDTEELDSKEEELLLALETAETKSEKLAVLKKLKAHYIQKNKKEEAKKVQVKLEKLKSAP